MEDIVFFENCKLIINSRSEYLSFTNHFFDLFKVCIDNKNEEVELKPYK